MRLLNRRIRSLCLVSAMSLLVLTACGDTNDSADAISDSVDASDDVEDVSGPCEMVPSEVSGPVGSCFDFEIKGELQSVYGTSWPWTWNDGDRQVSVYPGEACGLDPENCDPATSDPRRMHICFESPGKSVVSANCASAVVWIYEDDFGIAPSEVSGPVGSCFTFTLIGDLPSPGGVWQWGEKCGDGQWGSISDGIDAPPLWNRSSGLTGPSREFCFHQAGECWVGALGAEAHIVIHASGDVTTGGGSVQADAVGGGQVKVIVPDGAAAGNLTVTAVPLVDLVGTTVGPDLVADPEPDSIDAVVDLGPDGTVFNEPVAVQIPLSVTASPHATRRVFLVDEDTNALSIARMRDGTAIVGVVSGDGKSVGFQTDHFSKYAVGSLDSIFCPAGWATSFPLAVPCSFYSESAFAAAGTDAMLLEGNRTKMYVQVLKELFLRTERPRSDAETGLAELFTQNLDDVIADEPVPYKKVLKGAKYIQLMANDALASDLPVLVDFGPGLEAVSDGSKFILENTKTFTTSMKIADCVIEGLLSVMALHAVDYDRALERLNAARPFMVESNLYKKDPAFRAALAQVTNDITAIQVHGWEGQILEALSNAADSDCAMTALKSLIKFALKPLLTILKGTGAGLVASIIFDFTVVDVVMDDMVAATQKGLALSALGTFYVHGGLYEATKDLINVTPQTWQSKTTRDKLLARQVSNYANLAIHESAAEIMRMESAGWLNKNLTGAVDWTASLFGAVSREEIAKVHDARVAELDAIDQVIVDSYPSLCGGTGTQPAVCGATLPCIPVCGLSVCGDDGCGGSCGTCGEGSECIDGACEPSACDPQCGTRVCGPDPICGQSCGTCDSGYSCQDGECVEESGTWTPDDYTVDCQDGMCLVPAGSFWQGCNEPETYACFTDEYPYHEVTVPAFEIDKYEVTVDLYRDCVVAGVCTEPSILYDKCNWTDSRRVDHPMNCIDWYQAREYCEWAGKRLCTESEWEKASRGTDGRKYPWGNDTPTCEYCVLTEGNDITSCGRYITWPVGSKAAGASPYGAHDMCGNVHEWVEDDYHSSYTGAPTNGLAWLDDPRASRRVVRGSSFNYVYPNDDKGLLSWYRFGDEPDDPGFEYHAMYYFGARCCR